MLPEPYNPNCCAACNDYNPSANDPQHTLAHRYVRTALYPKAHLLSLHGDDKSEYPISNKGCRMLKARFFISFRMTKEFGILGLGYAIFDFGLGI
jgi:hypothetical protein